MAHPYGELSVFGDGVGYVGRHRGGAPGQREVLDRYLAEAKRPQAAALVVI
jgi:hypothetical protein